LQREKGASEETPRYKVCICGRRVSVEGR
jgi:hypothetical protein